MAQKTKNNRICRPQKPPKTRANAGLCLAMLLDGYVLSRKMLDQGSITFRNAPLRSIISFLRNKKFIPIESQRQPDGTPVYFMETAEIARYKNIALRANQCKEMKALIEKKRTRKKILDFEKLLTELANKDHPAWEEPEFLHKKLGGIVKEISALPEKQKRQLNKI